MFSYWRFHVLINIYVFIFSAARFMSPWKTSMNTSQSGARSALSSDDRGGDGGGGQGGGDVMFAKRRSMPVKLRRERCLRRLSRWTPLIGDHHKNYLIIIIIINIITLFIILIIIIVILFDTETVPQLSAMSAPTAYQALTSHLLLIRFGITITISFISHIINNVIITTK